LFLNKYFFTYISQKKELIRLAEENIHLAIISDKDPKKRHLLMNIVADNLGDIYEKKISFPSKVKRALKLEWRDISMVAPLPKGYFSPSKENFFLDEAFLSKKKDSSAKFFIRYVSKFSSKA